MTHVCNLRSVWPIGHALPPVDESRLEGPSVGTLCVLNSKYKPGLVVRVIEQSYVWSPGECRHNGGYRRYDWKVIDDEHGYCVVVNDRDLTPILPGMRITINE